MLYHLFMNPEAQAYLDEILKIEPENLTEEQKRFLRARSSYLKRIQLEEYASVLETKPLETETVKKHDKANIK